MDKNNGFISNLPLSRSEQLVVQNTGSETLVYDLKIDKAHHLNETSSIIWKHCDGQTSSEKLKEILSEKLKTEIEDDFIWLALVNLDKANLLEEKLEEKTDILSRRKVLMKYALPAVTVPMVMSLVTPVSAQMAGSCIAAGMICDPVEGPPCCPGLTCEGTCN